LTFRTILAIPAVVISALMISCSGPPVENNVDGFTPDGEYDSEMPVKAPGPYLEEIGESVKLISCIAYYRVYPFSLQHHVEVTGVTAPLLDAKSGEVSYANSSSAGTATIIYYQDRKIAFVTCAHVVAFPDTVVVYYADSLGRPLSYVRSVSIKERQSNYVSLFPDTGELEVLAIDKTSDLAILGRRLLTEPPVRVPVFKYPFGAARDLGWGAVVYLFGYPSGFKIITQGLVSSPRKDRMGSFLLNTGFSRGFSGGIVLALRDGVPHFELVGMVKTMSARTSFVLIPGTRDGVPEFDPSVPYKGEMYVEKRTEIESSVTQAVPAEAILDFIRSNAGALDAAGYHIGRALLPDMAR
jgi:hypothetical protein